MDERRPTDFEVKRMRNRLERMKKARGDDVAEYKKIQLQLEAKSKRVYMARNMTPGQMVTMPSGARYEVKKDGSWKRMK
jgi:hypothetical protein